MLKVQQYLIDFGLDTLQDQFKIKVRRHNKYPNLICLNYNQLESSPKDHPVVRECRGLILDEENNWFVVSYPYKRFFNYGEFGADEICWSSARTYEKLDGSLIQLYNYNNEWHIATRGAPDASGEVGSNCGLIFRDLAWDVFFNHEKYSLDMFLPEYNYFFELCTPYNRVIVPHKESRLVLHGCRNRNTLCEIDIQRLKSFNKPKLYKLNDWESISTAIQELDGVNHEGFIVVDAAFNRIKLKSPQYVALSHLKEGLTENRILEIVITNESDELLTYFPEYTEIYSKYQAAFDQLVAEIESVWQQYKNIEMQKDFALTIKHHPFSSVLFSLKNGKIQSIKQGLKEIQIEKLRGLLQC